MKILRLSLLAFAAVVTAWAIGNPDLDDRLLLSGFLGFALAATLWRPALSAVWILVALIELHGVTTATYSNKHRGDQNRFTRHLDDNKDIADFLRAAEREAPVRVDVTEADVPINFGDYHGVDVLGGYVAGVPENLLRAELHTDRSKALFAVTHYIGKQQGHPRQIPVFQGRSGVKVFRNPEVMPRAWSVHEAIRVATAPELRYRIQVEPIDFHQQIVLLGDTPSLETCTGDDIRIQSRNPDRARIRVSMRCTGMLILADSFYPGWEATVDGAPAHVWEAYGVVRGVVAPAGEHQIEFRFRPRSVYMGGGLFVLGLLLTAILTILRR